MRSLAREHLTTRHLMISSVRINGTTACMTIPEGATRHRGVPCFRARSAPFGPATASPGTISERIKRLHPGLARSRHRPRAIVSSSGRRHPIRLCRQLSFAFRRATREVATHLRTIFINRAKKLRPSLRRVTRLERGTVSIRHFHIGAVSDEVRHTFSLDAKPFPIGAGDAHVGIKLRKTTHSALETVCLMTQGAPAGQGRGGHGSAAWFFCCGWRACRGRPVLERPLLRSLDQSMRSAAARNRYTLSHDGPAAHVSSLAG